MNSSRMRFLSGVRDILSCKDQQHFAIFCNRARKEQGKGGRRLGASAPDESAARIAWRGKRGGNVMKVSIRPSRVTLMIGSASAALMLGFARSEEHTSELQSLMRISYAVFCLKKKNKRTKINTNT